MSASIGGSGLRGLPPYPYSFPKRALVPAIPVFAMVKSAHATIPCSRCASGRAEGSPLAFSEILNSLATVYYSPCTMSVD